MYLYMTVNTHVHVCTCTCIHTATHTYIRICTHAHVHVNVHVLCTITYCQISIQGVLYISSDWQTIQHHQLTKRTFLSVHVHLYVCTIYMYMYIIMHGRMHTAVARQHDCIYMYMTICIYRCSYLMCMQPQCM